MNRGMNRYEHPQLPAGVVSCKLQEYDPSKAVAFDQYCTVLSEATIDQNQINAPHQQQSSKSWCVAALIPPKMSLKFSNESMPSNSSTLLESAVPQLDLRCVVFAATSCRDVPCQHSGLRCGVRATAWKMLNPIMSPLEQFKSEGIDRLCRYIIGFVLVYSL